MVTLTKEEKISFDSKNTFYNSEMRFCRGFFSLAVGALEGKMKLLDAFCASGIRGIRYAKENKNVKEITFLDLSKNAIVRTKKNIKINKITRANVVCVKIEKFCTNFLDYDFVEIDPFGTPVPYLNDIMRSQNDMKEWYLSVSATDTAVLCGPQATACLKNYHSKSLNNEFTHEVGTRIFIKRVAEAASEHNFGIVPLISLSDRHYIKLFLKVVRGAEASDDTVNQFGYVSYCNICGWRSTGKRMKNKCEQCKSETDYGGQLWLGELHDKKILQKMLVLNEKRNYTDAKEIEKKLNLLIGEVGMPAFYYNVHLLCKKVKSASVPKIEDFIKKLRAKGYMATKTHFNEISVKSDAEISKLKKLIK
ncbi:MAG: hypothetical protein Q7S22_06125 [Candidatus Micrarchaeota archaeon]|nr:hypothetical protein [Candidatus Micrarchaeota archaeon]